jgi:hypothetical protein
MSTYECAFVVLLVVAVSSLILGMEKVPLLVVCQQSTEICYELVNETRLLREIQGDQLTWYSCMNHIQYTCSRCTPWDLLY